MKSSTLKTDPGPNFFSSAASNVWVDDAGRMHLKITKTLALWYSAEVVLDQSLGRGTYRFALDSPVDGLDPNMVLGVFTWSDDAAYAHREIDIEFSRWGDASDPTNAQYVVQPSDLPDHKVRFAQPVSTVPSVHAFTWGANDVRFASARGTVLPASRADSISAWTYTGAVPEPGPESVRMNLWLTSGKAPKNGQEAEVIIRDFTFTPA